MKTIIINYADLELYNIFGHLFPLEWYISLNSIILVAFGYSKNDNLKKYFSSLIKKRI